MLRLIIELFTDLKDEELLELTQKCFIEISKYLNNDDRGLLILSTIIGFANDDNEDTRLDSRCLAVRLFSELAATLGKDFCEQYIVPQLIFLSDDKHFKVRKAVAQSLVNVSLSLSYSVFTNKIVMIYKK